MGFRIRKSFRVAKGVRVNLSKSGLGISGGVKGARISSGPRGTRITGSISGTGLSYSQKIGPHTKRHLSPAYESARRELKIPEGHTASALLPAAEQILAKRLSAGVLWLSAVAITLLIALTGSEALLVITLLTVIPAALCMGRWSAQKQHVARLQEMAREEELSETK